MIEVGAGLGVLTERLKDAAGRVVAVEVDPELCDYLRTKFAAAENVRVVEQDILNVDPAALASGAYGVVGNLPYNIGAAVLRHFLEADRPPRWLVVMLQKEVAEAVAAGAGAMSVVGVAVQVYAEARVLFSVAPDAFYPPPRVRSAVIRLDVRSEPQVPGALRERFFSIVRGGFSAPRKHVRNSLAQGLGLRPAEAERALLEAGIDPSLRPERLAIQDWLRLTRALETIA